MRQFRYWYGQRDDLLEIRRKRLGPAKYEKDNRAITGSAVAGIFGIGSRFEIDSTPLDVSAVAELDRRTVVGRPTFYQINDVLSKLTCGIYVGFEEASWMAATLALRNVVEDKVEFARRYGVVLEPHQWPCQGVLPARILADRGEFKGHMASDFALKSLVQIENAAPYRGDLKGGVEQRFELFHRQLKKVLDGFVTKNHAERGEKDYRLQSILTLKEITAAVIETVIVLNGRKLRDYPRSREMMADKVYAVPREMWAWAHERGNTELRSATLDDVNFAALPTGQASVTERGVSFKGLYYVGDDPRDDMFAHARQDGRKKVKLSYDPLCCSFVYLHDRSQKCGYVKWQLTSHDVRWAGLGFEEVEMIKKDDRVDTANRQFEQAAQEARFLAETTAINATAKKGRKGKLKPKDLAAMKDNRQQEKKHERADRNGRPLGSGNDAGDTNVVEFDSYQQRRDDKLSRLGSDDTHDDIEDFLND